MIPVAHPIPEPPLFDTNCRVPGRAFLAKNPTADCHQAAYLWTPFRPPLRRAFAQRCGYLAVKLYVGGVVDHHVSCHEDRTRAFEWTNYRYVSETVNSRKQALDRRRVRALDPFDVEEGWFRVILPSFELVLTDTVPAAMTGVAQETIDKLQLGNGHEAIEARWSVYESHWNNGDIDMIGLAQDAPLIAAAVEARRREGKPLPSPLDSPLEPPAVIPRKRAYAPRKRKNKS